jgi:hypothetical protein
MKLIYATGGYGWIEHTVTTISGNMWPTTLIPFEAIPLTLKMKNKHGGARPSLEN